MVISVMRSTLPIIENPDPKTYDQFKMLAPFKFFFYVFDLCFLLKFTSNLSLSLYMLNLFKVNNLFVLKWIWYRYYSLQISDEYLIDM